jgi:predicted DNA-binding protein with PD1-like motif
MAAYKIRKGSVKVKGGSTSLEVKFYDSEGVENESWERFEVQSVDKEDIYEALDNAALGFVDKPTDETPKLTVDTKIEVA